MSNSVQLKRTAVAGKVPQLADILVGELALNLLDKSLFTNNGSEVVQLNHAANITTDAEHQFVTSAQISAWEAGFTLEAATSNTLGGVKVGNNIEVDATGVISVGTASTNSTGVLTQSDWNLFNSKQDALGFTPVDRQGDTLLGPLLLAGAPTQDNEAANMKFVVDGLATKVDLSGGTLLGDLKTSIAPESLQSLVNRGFVESAVASVSGVYASPVADLAELAALVDTALVDRQIRLVEDTGAIYRYDLQSAVAADGVGVVEPSSGNGRWFKVQSATQNHNLMSGLQGGDTNDYQHLTTSEKVSLLAHSGDTALHLSAEQNTWLDAINVTSTEVNYLSGVTGLIQNQLNSKQAALGFTPVNLAGDTMAGPLLLAQNPVAQMEAVNLGYLQSYTLDAGTF